MNLIWSFHLFFGSAFEGTGFKQLLIFDAVAFRDNQQPEFSGVILFSFFFAEQICSQIISLIWSSPGATPTVQSAWFCVCLAYQPVYHPIIWLAAVGTPGALYGFTACQNCGAAGSTSASQLRLEDDFLFWYWSSFSFYCAPDSLAVSSRFAASFSP